jgi:hypothetical protein
MSSTLVDTTKEANSRPTATATTTTIAEPDVHDKEASRAANDGYLLYKRRYLIAASIFLANAANSALWAA